MYVEIGGLNFECPDVRCNQKGALRAVARIRQLVTRPSLDERQQIHLGQNLLHLEAFVSATGEDQALKDLSITKEEYETFRKKLLSDGN